MCSSSHKLLISAQVSIFPQLMRLSIDKGHVIVNITVNVWIRSAGTRQRDGEQRTIWLNGLNYSVVTIVMVKLRWYELP